MLKKSAVENILAAALESGADFAEIYAERTKRSSIAMVNGKVETALGGMDYGAGVRLFFGNQAIYGFTNDLSEESLIRIAREGAAALRGDRIYDICGWKRMAERCINPIRILPESVSKQRKAEQLRLASAAARAYHDAVTQTRAGYLEVMKHVLVANSEGIWGEENRTRSRFTIEAVASSATEKQSGHLGPGGSEGYELFDRINVEDTAREAARIAVTMLGAKPCPAGKIPVVIDNGFGGVIFHEACGHGLEATAVARNASVFAGRLGQQMDNLDVTDTHYDKKISDLQRRLDAQYDRIDEAYSECTDAEKKQFMQAFIERIDIFPERREDGNWIQNIKFQFPVPIIKEGKEVAQIKGISLDKEKSNEHMVSLEKLSTLETIVSLNKTAI